MNLPGLPLDGALAALARASSQRAPRNPMLNGRGVLGHLEDIGRLTNADRMVDPVIAGDDVARRVGVRKVEKRDFVMDYLDGRAEGLRPKDAYADVEANYDLAAGGAPAAATRIRKTIRRARDAGALSDLEENWRVSSGDLETFADNLATGVDPNSAQSIARRGIAEGWDREAIRSAINAQRSIDVDSDGPIDNAVFKVLLTYARRANNIPPLQRRIDWDMHRPEIERRWSAGETDAQIIRDLNLPRGGVLGKKWAQWYPGVAKPNNRLDKQRTGARPDRGGAMEAVRAARTAPNKGNTTAKFDTEEQSAIAAYRAQNPDAGIRKIAADLGMSIGKVQRALARVSRSSSNVVPMVAGGGALGALNDWREAA